VLLDSGQPAACAGRFDIVAADPGTTLTTRARATKIATRNGSYSSSADPLTLLREALGERQDTGLPDDCPPFAGGAIGYFAYDLGRLYERIGGIALDDIGCPEMVVGIYDWAVVVDHEACRSWLVGEGRDPQTIARWDELVGRLSAEPPRESGVPFEVVSAVRSNLTRDGYAAAFDRVKRHIRQGDCYQVNLAQRFDARVQGDSWHAYLALRAANPAPFSAYLELPEAHILSSSPELFLRVVDGCVETKPIKGTRRRSVDVENDRRLAAELAASAKDRPRTS
jgi:para-aminobenzoate synthetase component 1